MKFQVFISAAIKRAERWAIQNTPMKTYRFLASFRAHVGGIPALLSRHA